jgi:hypothetical protein
MVDSLNGSDILYVILPILIKKYHKADIDIIDFYEVKPGDVYIPQYSFEIAENIMEVSTHDQNKYQWTPPQRRGDEDEWFDAKDAEWYQ